MVIMALEIVKLTNLLVNNGLFLYGFDPLMVEVLICYMCCDHDLEGNR